jgi:putative SOS response-associated peptidase YedK
MTTAPNELVAPIHDRMPVILPPDLVDAWLDTGTTPAELAPMLTAAPEANLRIWPVSGAVNRVGTDGPELLLSVDLPPTLGLV